MTRVVAANVKDRELVRDRRRQLVEAALAVFLRKGYHDTTVRDIGRQGGFTQGTIYNYVRSKSDILYLVCDEVVRAYQDAVARAVAGASDPASRLSSAVHAVVAELHEHQDAILLLYQESHALDTRSLQGILVRVSEYIEMFERLLAEAARDGRIPPLNARLAANVVTFLPTMVALRRWDLRGRLSREALLRGVTEFILRGLGAAVPGPSPPGNGAPGGRGAAGRSRARVSGAARERAGSAPGRRHGRSRHATGAGER
jgi:AcrR family transcriptional regulator